MGIYSKIITLPAGAPPPEGQPYELGNPYTEDRSHQLGYEVITRSAILSLSYALFSQWPAEQITADVHILNGEVYEGVDLPCEMPVPLATARINLRPLAELTNDVQVCAYLRESSAFPTTGMRRTRQLPDNQSGIEVPVWARALSGPFVAGGITIELGDAAGVFPGPFIGPTDSPASLPNWVRQVRQSGADPNAWVVFYGGRG